MLCIPQELAERRTGAGGDDIEIFCRHGFHSRILDFRIQFQSFADGPQESALFGDGFEQRDLRAASQKLGQHQPRKASATAEICECCGVLWDVGGKLRTVPDVPPPDIGHRGGRHEIVAAVPVFQHPDIGL